MAIRPANAAVLTIGILGFLGLLFWAFRDKVSEILSPLFEVAGKVTGGVGVIAKGVEQFVAVSIQVAEHGIDIIADEVVFNVRGNTEAIGKFQELGVTGAQWLAIHQLVIEGTMPDPLHLFDDPGKGAWYFTSLVKMTEILGGNWWELKDWLNIQAMEILNWEQQQPGAGGGKGR